MNMKDIARMFAVMTLLSFVMFYALIVDSIASEFTKSAAGCVGAGLGTLIIHLLYKTKINEKAKKHSNLANNSNNGAVHLHNCAANK